MTDRQTNRATGLFLPWTGPRDGAGPAHAQLAALVRSEINTGRLRPGDRLPPSRGLAEQLGVSRWVITEAYDQLTAEGYLSARVGSGTVVAATAAADRIAAAATPAVGAATAIAPQPTVPGIDLSPALPDLRSFPRALWRGALTRALTDATAEQLGHPDPLGSVQVRATMAGYLRRVRAIEAAPERVLITQGVASAVDELCAHLRADGAARVAMEDPSWPRLREIARRHGLDVVPIGVDGEGLRTDHLIEQARRARVAAVFTMPTHQFPTGVAMSADRRRALLDWAHAHGVWIVEDDYDAEFRYDRHPVGAMASLGPDRVVYLGSVSKTLSPSLHLGWLVTPPGLQATLAERRIGTGLAPLLDQLALADLVTSGAYDRHLRRMRRHYQRRRQALLAALERHTPGRPAEAMDAGLHVLWLLPESTDEDAVLRRCAAAGLAVLGLSRCRTAPGRAGVVLGCANLPEHRADDVARALTAALAVGAAR